MAPRVGHFTALDDQVINRAFAETVTNRQTGVTRANNNGIDGLLLSRVDEMSGLIDGDGAIGRVGNNIVHGRSFL
jgi:hypothetical protein